MKKVIVEMAWEIPTECSVEQRIHLHNMIDTFMNNVAEKFAWYEETFSIENKTEERETE